MSNSNPQSTTPSETSDGYHTFNELYDHRIALFIALMKSHLDISWRATPGTDGWFLAGMFLPTGNISYHLPENRFRDCHPVRVLNQPPHYDGYTPADVVARLNAWNPDNDTKVNDLAKNGSGGDDG